MSQIEKSQEFWTPKDVQFKGTQQQSASQQAGNDEMIKAGSCTVSLAESTIVSYRPRPSRRALKFSSHGCGCREI